MKLHFDSKFCQYPKTYFSFVLNALLLWDRNWFTKVCTNCPFYLYSSTFAALYLCVNLVSPSPILTHAPSSQPSSLDSDPGILRIVPADSRAHRSNGRIRRQTNGSAALLEVRSKLSDTASVSAARASPVPRTSFGTEFVQPGGWQLRSPAGFGGLCTDIFRNGCDQLRNRME